MQLHPTKLVKTFLQKNPDLMQSYIDWGTILVGSALNPLGAILLHLIELQGLDPNTSSIQKYCRELEEALAAVNDPKDFDSDYDLSWVTKKWQETNRGLKDFTLTQQKFRELTDLSDVADKPSKFVPAEVIVGERGADSEDDFFAKCTEINRVASPAPKREIPITTEEREARDQRKREVLERMKAKIDLSSKYGRQEYRKVVAEEDILDNNTKFNPGGFMEDKLNELEELLQKMEKDSPPKSKPTKKANKITKVNRINKRPFIKKEPATRLSDDNLLRAEKLAREMVVKGLCDDNNVAIEAQIAELASLSKPLEDLAKIIKRHTPKIQFSKNAYSEAEKLQALIKKGHLNPQDLHELITHGANQESVDCWKHQHSHEYNETTKFKGNFRRAPSKG